MEVNDRILCFSVNLDLYCYISYITNQCEGIYVDLENFPYSLTDHAIKRITERNINLEWINRVLSQPQRSEPDPEDPELRHALGTIPE